MDFNYTVRYKDLDSLLDRIEELEPLMYELISYYVEIETIDYTINTTLSGDYLITFFGTGTNTGEIEYRIV